ncbi:hypothetical protein [Streptomyces noursei]
MTKFEAGTLYAARRIGSDRARPVRIVDQRRWTSVCAPTLNGFHWAIEVPEQWRHYSKSVGVAALYWSAIGDEEPDTEALLNFPWEPLAQDTAAAAEEMTRRAADATIGPGSQPDPGAPWLCLGPVAREDIVCRWDEYDYEELRRQARRASEERLLRWKHVNRRLEALDLEPVQRELGGLHALLTLEQLTALLDRAEGH